MRIRPRLKLGIAACASLLLAGSAPAALTVAPTTVSNSFNGVITLTITGLNNAGQTVIVEKHFDANNSNSVNTGDLLLQRFKVTDGQVTNLAGRRNLNVPGDEDGAANSSIQTKLYFSPEEIPGRIDGRFIFRVSPDGAGFAPFTGTLMLTQQDYGGSGFTGKVMAGATAQSGAIVLIISAASDDFDIRGVTKTDASGNYSMKLPAGAYRSVPAKSGFVFNVGTAPLVTVNAGSMAASANALLVTRTRTIAGAVRDDTPSHATVPGVLVFAQSEAGMFSFSFSDTAGNFVLDAAAGESEFGVAIPGPLSLHGLVRQSGFSNASAGNVTGFNLDMPRATALIYGTVRTPAGAAVPFVDVRAETDGDPEFESSGVTDASGNYTLGVTPGSWGVEGESALHLFSQEEVDVNAAGTAVLRDLTAHTITTHLRGIARDNSNNPVANLALVAQANDGTRVNATTAANGSFDLGIYGGTVENPKEWWIQLDGDDDGPANYISTYPNFQVTDGTDINGINFLVYAVTAHLRGQVLDENNAPFSNGNININANLQGGSAQSDSDLQSDGSFDIGVFNGTWNLGLSNLSGSGVLEQSNFQVTVVNNADQNGLIFRVRHTTGTISGTVKNTLGVGLATIRVGANTSIGGVPFGTTALTGAGGNYSIPVFPATWTVQPNSFGPEGLGNLGYDPVSSQNVTTGAGNSIVNFVASQPDNTPPSLVSSLPVNGATGVAPTSSISFTFSEAMQPGHSITWSANVQADAFSYSWSGDARTLTCTDMNNLPSGATISWVLNQGAIGDNFRDLAGNRLPSDISGSFTTSGSPPDNTPPSLVSSLPANGATGVALNSTVSFTFSEPMQQGYSINWSPNVNPNQFSNSWSGDGRTLTLTYSLALPAGATITWTLNPNGFGQNFRDVPGNPLPSDVSGSFTTEASTNGTWTYKPFMPTARSGSRAAIINGLLYVVGGLGSPPVSGRELEVYDPHQGTWQSLAPMPTARHSAGVGSIDGKLYVAGGSSGGTTLEVYDPVSNTWETKQSMHLNHQGAAAVIGNKLYVVGPSTNFTNSLEVYDPVTDAWTVKTPMPNPRAAGAAALNGLLYTVGGDSFGTVEAYDPVMDSWSPKASLPGNGTPIYDPGVAVMDGKLYAAGGFNHGTTVDVYDPALNQWSFGPPMFMARGDLTVAALPDKLFAIGGVQAPGQVTLPFMEQLNLSASDRLTTIVLRSDTATLAAGLGSGVPSAATLHRLNTDDTAGLTFQPALAGAFGVTNFFVPVGSPAGTQIINIPPGNGQNGFFRLTFVLPPGFSGAQLSFGAVMDFYGRAFLNGNALTPAIDPSQPSPAPGTIDNQDGFFSTRNQSFFRTGTNTVDFADINANGGASAGAFFAFATFVVNPPLPPLTITRSGANVILTWPAADTGWTLQSSANLNAPGVWPTVSPAPVILNGLHTVTSPIAGTRKFFRLGQ